MEGVLNVLLSRIIILKVMSFVNNAIFLVELVLILKLINACRVALIIISMKMKHQINVRSALLKIISFKIVKFAKNVTCLAFNVKILQLQDA